MTIQPVANFDQVIKSRVMIVTTIKIVYIHDHCQSDLRHKKKATSLMSKIDQNDQYAAQLPPDRVAALVKAGKEWDEFAAAG